ncbi:phosphatidylinositol/phosphatidylcholine transfer protein SFH11 isoform X2 [Cicer arietinum]|uniref:Phosphatidylinositol/phosphatidylcholine transfer protein SFH11 isoform X2 n=1 Tax=Cicer arietinum TaxID=3827 RepID=A0A1S3EGB0_CICAR|nr:phosphatidylinositol/phosphatidylcholine transfer protein SFH11 isoform X2 [Cicer arietinum]
MSFPKTKGEYRDITITRSDKEDSVQRSKFKSGSFSRKKTLHPPIETHWHLPEQKVEEKVSFSIKSLFSFMKLRRSKSLQIILEGTHDPDDEQIIETFRELLSREGLLPSKHNDYHTLLRFLRMNDFDMTVSRDMFLNYLKWRKEFRVDMLHKEFEFTEYTEVKKCYPHGYHGVDRCGRPLYIERIGMIDINKLCEVTTHERFIRHHVSEQEKTLRVRYPACSLQAKKHIASTTSILDVNGVGMSNFSKPARFIFMEIQKIDSSYYPETLNKLFIVNAGSRFKMLWKAVKAFLSERTVAKIQVLGSNYLNVLLEVIDPSNLPTFLGGNCTCSDYGGCLMSDQGPWKNSDLLEIIQAVPLTEEIDGTSEDDDVPSEGSLIPQKVDMQNKDYVSMSLALEKTTYARTNSSCRLALQKIDWLEVTLGEIKDKIKILEDALQDTKMALKELAHHTEQQKM